MPHWIRRPDGLLAWVLLLAAVFNFTPALFTNESLTEAALSTRVVKDAPVLILIAMLLVQVGHSRSRGAHRGVSDHPSIRGLGRVLRGCGTPAEDRAALFLAVSGMGAFVVMSLLLVSSPSLGVLASVRYYVVYPALALLLALSGRANLRPLAIGVVILGCLQTLVAVLDFMGAWGPTYYAGEVELAGYIFPRAIGTLGNPNNLGIFLAFSLIIVVSAGEWHTGWGRAALIVLAVGILLTFSKTVVMALALSYAGAVWAWGRRQGARKAMLLLGVLVFLVVLMASSRATAPAGVLGAFGSRGVTANRALGEWLEGPFEFFLGHGFGSEVYVDAAGALQERVTDNMALSLAVEGGIVGLLLFTLIVAVGFRLIFHHSASQTLGRVSRRYAVLFLAYTPLASNFRLFPGALLFWILVGLSASVDRRGA